MGKPTKPAVTIDSKTLSKFATSVCAGDCKTARGFLEGQAVLANCQAPKGNKWGYTGWLPLGMAAQCNHPEMMRLLLSKGADPYLQDKHGKTAAERARYRPELSAIIDEHNRKKDAPAPAPAAAPAAVVVQVRDSSQPQLAAAPPVGYSPPAGYAPAAAPTGDPASQLAYENHRCAQFDWQLQALAWETKRQPPALPAHLQHSPAATMNPADPSTGVAASRHRAAQLEWMLQALAYETQRPAPPLPPHMQQQPAAAPAPAAYDHAPPSSASGSHHTPPSSAGSGSGCHAPPPPPEGAAYAPPPPPETGGHAPPPPPESYAPPPSSGGMPPPPPG